MLRVYYSDDRQVQLPARHRFPMQKYAMLREALLRENILQSSQMVSAPPITRQALERAHNPAYVEAVLSGQLDRAQERAIGLPWSRALVDRELATVGGTLAAARHALRTGGFAGMLAGGTHHATWRAGEGFCMFNDVAVATLELLETGEAESVVVLDLDVHQGNGNAEILAPCEDVFVCSVHAEHNYPFTKPASDLDVALGDGTGDEEYLDILVGVLEEALSGPVDLVMYIAGVDPLEGDRLGRLALSEQGLRARDSYVLTACDRRGIPVALSMGGGYAEPIERSVQAHVNTYRVARMLKG